MQDFVIVSKGQEEKFIAEAKALGYDSLVLLYKNKSDVGNFKSDFVKSGLFLEKKSSSDFSSFDIVVALGTSFNKLPKGVTHVVMNEFEREILFAFAGLQESAVSGQRSAQVIGRMMQNSKMCKFELVSLASDVFSMRNSSDVKAFSRVLKKKLL